MINNFPWTVLYLVNKIHNKLIYVCLTEPQTIYIPPVVLCIIIFLANISYWIISICTVSSWHSSPVSQEVDNVHVLVSDLFEESKFNFYSGFSSFSSFLFFHADCTVTFERALKKRTINSREFCKQGAVILPKTTVNIPVSNERDDLSQLITEPFHSLSIHFTWH